MCKHKFIKVNDVDFCAKCGLTLFDGKFLRIDKKLISRFGKRVKQ